jgi:hypothetical protein
MTINLVPNINAGGEFVSSSLAVVPGTTIAVQLAGALACTIEGSVDGVTFHPVYNVAVGPAPVAVLIDNSSMIRVRAVAAQAAPYLWVTTAAVQPTTTGAFSPDPAGTYPSYTTAGELQSATVDVLGQQNARAAIYTDEGGFVEPFAGTALDAAWTAVSGGGTITVVGSNLVITPGSTPSDLVYVSRPVDFLPLRLDAFMELTGRGAASVGYDFFIGLYNAADPTAATQFHEWLFTGSLTDVQADIRSQAHAGAGGGEAATVTVTSTLTAGFRTIALDTDGGVYRDGSTALPTPTVRGTQSRQPIGFYSKLHVAMGFRNAGVLGVTPVTATIDTILINNLNRVSVNGAL